jgi:hypothetical protein
MRGDRILGWCWGGCALVLALSPMWHDYGGLWPTVAAMGGAMGFLSAALRHFSIAEPPHD